MLILLLVTSSVFASDFLNIELRDNTNNLNISNIELTYSSSTNPFCAKYKKGSFQAKNDFINNRNIKELKVPKSYFKGVCRYQLSMITLFAPNQVNYDVYVVRIPVKNSFNSYTYRKRVIAEKFNFTCSKVGLNACQESRATPYDVASTERNEVVIFLDDK